MYFLVLLMHLKILPYLTNLHSLIRLLKALGAPKNARIYWAGGIPLGGKEALQPLTSEFPQFFNKEDLALPGELEPFAKKASLMAALDYIVTENSNVFMPSHGGNMGHALQVLPPLPLNFTFFNKILLIGLSEHVLTIGCILFWQ